MSGVRLDLYLYRNNFMKVYATKIKTIVHARVTIILDAIHHVYLYSNVEKILKSIKTGITKYNNILRMNTILLCLANLI